MAAAKLHFFSDLCHLEGIITEPCSFITMTSQWAWWRLKSPAAPLFTQSFINSGCRSKKSSASLAFLRGIHRWPVNSPHKGQVTRKIFPFDDVIMMGLYLWYFILIWLDRKGDKLNRWPVNSPHKGQVTRKIFPFDDVIMMGLYLWCFILIWLDRKGDKLNQLKVQKTFRHV